VTTRGVRLLIGLALIAATVAVGAGLVRVHTDTTTASFLPVHDPTQTATLEAARSFGADPIVVIAEARTPGGLLVGDQITRLVALEGRLARLPDVAAVYGPGTVLNQVARSAQNLLATIVGRRDGLQQTAEARARARGASPSEVRRAGQRAIRRYDVRYGSLLVRGLPAGLPTLRNPRFVHSVVFDADGQPRPQWRFVVPRPDAVAIVVRPREQLDQASTEALVHATERTVAAAGLEATRTTVSGMPVVAAGLGGVLRHEVPLVGLCALLLIAGCYLLLPWLPNRTRRLVPVLVTLSATAITLAAFGWLDHPLSLGVIAFLPILLGTGSDFPAYLVRGADRRTVAVTASAAAAGFATLALSPAPFVRDLGLALAAGVLVTLLTGLLITRGASTSDPDRKPSATPTPAVFGRPLGRGRRAALLVAAAAVSVLGWIALPHLQIEGQPEHLAAGVPALADANHAQAVLGSAGEVRVLVRGSNVLTPQTLAWMDRVQDVVVRRFGDRLRPVVSPPTLLAFLGTDPSAEQLRAGLAQLPAYLRTSVVRDDGREAVLSYGIELEDVGAQSALLDQLRAAIPTPPAGLHADLAGLPVVTSRGYELVSADRYLSGLAGIAAAGMVLLAGLPRRSDAMRAVLSAALATGWGYAAALVLGLSLTPLTVALGSLAAATACEFSVLLGAEAGRGDGRIRRAVLVAAAAATSGYLALTTSHLVVIRDFGVFLAATVLLSLLAAHLVRRLLAPQPAGSAAEATAQVATAVAPHPRKVLV
jgi:predicted RND superfamily exporter protein